MGRHRKEKVKTSQWVFLRITTPKDNSRVETLLDRVFADSGPLGAYCFEKGTKKKSRDHYHIYCKGDEDDIRALVKELFPETEGNGSYSLKKRFKGEDVDEPKSCSRLLAYMMKEQDYRIYGIDDEVVERAKLINDQYVEEKKAKRSHYQVLDELLQEKQVIEFNAIVLEVRKYFREHDGFVSPMMLNGYTDTFIQKYYKNQDYLDKVQVNSFRRKYGLPEMDKVFGVDDYPGDVVQYTDVTSDGRTGRVVDEIGRQMEEFVQREDISYQEKKKRKKNIVDNINGT